MIHTIQNLRNDATAIFQAGITAADPYLAVKHCLSVGDAGDHSVEIVLDLENPAKKRVGRWSAVHLIAFGKAACAMAKAAQEIIPAQLITHPGIAVTNYENQKPVANFQVIGAGHPLPDASGYHAATLIAGRVAQAKQNELVLVLVSGGGSALLPLPAKGITLQEKIATTELLLASGANINQINCVRRHLSQLKGGGLARLTAPADLHALILSDVVGDDLGSIASGPTVADDSYFADAVTILQQKHIFSKVPKSVRTLLNRGCRGEISETPKNDEPLFNAVSYTLLGSNRISISETLRSAQARGYEARLYNDQLTGETRDEAEELGLQVKEFQQKSFNKAMAILAGGETTVTLTGSGRGGRNQEMALAFAIAAEKHDLAGNWVFLSGGTDGRDGPTDAAGGIVDNNSLKRINRHSVSARELLENNDSYNALKLSQDLLNTGATGTNVADLQVLLIQPTS